jgi:hypothetical protein
MIKVFENHERTLEETKLLFFYTLSLYNFYFPIGD